MNEEAHNYFLIAKSSRDREDSVSGLAAIAKAIEISPSGATYWLLKGQLHEIDGNMEKVEESYKKVTELQPTWNKGWSALGLFYSQNDLFDKAIECFRKSVDIELDVPSLTHLANLELNSSPQEALEHARLALTIEPDWQEAIDIRDEAFRKCQPERIGMKISKQQLTHKMREAADKMARRLGIAHPETMEENGQLLPAIESKNPMAAQVLGSFRSAYRLWYAKSDELEQAKAKGSDTTHLMMEVMGLATQRDETEKAFNSYLAQR